MGRWVVAILVLESNGSTAVLLRITSRSTNSCLADSSPFGVTRYQHANKPECPQVHSRMGTRAPMQLAAGDRRSQGDRPAELLAANFPIRFCNIGHATSHCSSP